MDVRHLNIHRMEVYYTIDVLGKTIVSKDIAEISISFIARYGPVLHVKASYRAAIWDEWYVWTQKVSSLTYPNKNTDCGTCTNQIASSLLLLFH